MQTPTQVKKIFATTAVEKTYVKVEELVKDSPLSSLVISAAAGAAIGFVLPVSRLIKLGVTLYPFVQAYISATETSATKNIIKH